MIIIIINYLTLRAKKININTLTRTGKDGRIIRKLNQWFKNDTTLTDQQIKWLT
jgi:hypothetical protein